MSKHTDTMSKQNDDYILGRHYFDNGYGASVICNHMSYGHEEGLLELAVISKRSDGTWGLCYTTPITDDVIGWLNEKEVKDLLQKIKALPKNTKAAK